MTHDTIIELLGAYALDAVDGDEAEEIRRHLHACPRCRAEVSELREVAAQLSYSGAAAPTGIWERIADSLEQPPPPLQLKIERRGNGWSRTIKLVGAAAAVVILVVLSAGLMHVRSDLRDLRQTSTVQLADRANRTMNASGSRIARLTGTGSDAATAVVGADGQGYLLGETLPTLSGRIYQLWGATTTGTVTSLGTMPGPGIYAFTADPSIHVVMVTIEDAPVASPSSAAIAAGTLS